MDSLTFLAQLDKAKIQPIYAVHGDDDFLKRQVLTALRNLILGKTDSNEFSQSAHPGDRADYATVMDELNTIPFFGPRRLVVVDNADSFVTRYRPQLEKAVEQLPPTGVLILEVKTWPATTKLAKKIKDAATIACKAPPSGKLPKWCIDWTLAHHDKQLTLPAANLLVELIGSEMGQLDQELAKLAVYAGTRKRITDEDVDTLVGRSQAQNTWKIFDAIGEGKTREALTILGRLFDQNEEPLRIVGAFSMQLRRLAQAHRLAQQGKSLPLALEQAGVQPYFVRAAQQQLKHLGPDRAGKLYDWLLEINLDLRGNSPLPPRTLLERLVIRLAARQP
jgi:DNA polymerase-3 subunit delta